MNPRKALLAVEWKDVEKGTFRARFATLLAVDADKDVTFEGAFPDGKEVPISAYGHQSWMGALPVGKGVVSSDEKGAYIDGGFFLDTADGINTYRTVKGLGSLQEWSYGYTVLEASYDEEALAQYPGARRGLMKVDVHEVSPVLMGAGVDTATESIKDGGLVAAGEGLLAQMEAFKARVIARAEFRSRVEPGKAGRRLSSATRAHLEGLVSSLTEAAAGLRDLLEESDAVPTEADDGKSSEVPADILQIFAASQSREAELNRQFNEEYRRYAQQAGREA